MRCQLAIVLPSVFLALALAAAADKPLPRAGWLGVFPDLPGYQREFLAPVVGEGKTPAAYRQTARYEWTGGAIKMLDVTLARDPAFKQKHAADALRKEKPAPKEVPIGKRTGWLWDLAAEGGGGANHPVARLVVPLGDDKALILEAKGAGPWGPLTDLAGRFDLARIEAALAEPPRTAFGRTLEEFRALKKGSSLGDLHAWLGTADKYLPGNNATFLMFYYLPDDAQVTLKLDYSPQDASLPSRLREAVLVHKDGRTEKLVE